MTLKHFAAATCIVAAAVLCAAASPQPIETNGGKDTAKTTDGKNEPRRVLQKVAKERPAAIAPSILPRGESPISSVDAKPEPDKAKDGAEYAKQDLAAQQDMARYALWMTLVAAFSLIASSVGLWLLYRTLYHTRRAADAAIASVREAKEATKAATLTYTEQVAASRPILMVDAGTVYVERMDLDDGPAIFAMFTVTNKGKQPCWIEAIWSGVWDVPVRGGEPQDDMRLPEQFLERRTGFLAEGQSMLIERHMRPQMIDYDRFFDPSVPVMLWGVCQYRGPSGVIFSTRFGYLISTWQEATRGRNVHRSGGTPCRARCHWEDGRVAQVMLEPGELIRYI